MLNILASSLDLILIFSPALTICFVSFYYNGIVTIVSLKEIIFRIKNSNIIRMNFW